VNTEPNIQSVSWLLSFKTGFNIGPMDSKMCVSSLQHFLLCYGIIEKEKVLLMSVP